MNTKLKEKQNVLGQVVRPKIEESFDIPEEKLKEPLFEEGAVVRCFCFGCGISTEITAEGAIHLAEKAEADVPLSWEGFYFVSEECIVCGKDFKRVSFKKNS
ncbi:MAG: hypothetical protein UU67_C0080G0001 [Candidatus Daviesbacteria bacterium GW2011_GWB1_41_5]|uniref:Uncharacterized protein n=1 Tax=Candidatus Daviesbacteria bacterium GW2011_GWB1_41_5 TaxID=1618429 RepID=A0A0G0WE61_9BACT|nr:MAG: hypothetical protein UU67_C0080G0001 [Candidatus Daviesbacteria bacterium GW2011_GWB1_41_5]